MKRLLICLFLTGITQVLFAQLVVEKTYQVASDQPILLKFDFPKVKISNWNKKEVYVKAIVNINDGKNNDKFTMLDKTLDGRLIISDSIDFKHIESEYLVEVNGEKKKFESKEDFESYKEAHKGEKLSFYSTNNTTDIQIEVMLPSNDNIVVQSKFGLVEVNDFTGPLTVTTEFGKISARLKEANVGKITLTNHFGKIYSNFDFKPISNEEKMFYTSITAAPGNGPTYSFTSKFGNIYLRDTK